jgi:hypothetical protein
MQSVGPYFFDKDTYGVWQEGPLLAPFPSKMRANTVVFDFPYFDLLKASNVRGAVAWGAHNAGMEFSAKSPGPARRARRKVRRVSGQSMDVRLCLTVVGTLSNHGQRSRGKRCSALENSALAA